MTRFEALTVVHKSNQLETKAKPTLCNLDDFSFMSVYHIIVVVSFEPLDCGEYLL